VGQALKSLQPHGTIDYPYSSDDVPWWRVISSAGVISPREPDAMLQQALKLREEGVEVGADNRINLGEYGWFPETEFDDYS
jgi:methylated-DNA-protein-cysteine methyltransferase-like protein